MSKPTSVTVDRWQSLRSATSARIALGRAGGSLTTREWLRFKSAHAAARDAVHIEFDAEELARELKELGVATVTVNSGARDRLTFLKRPDIGRQLDEQSRRRLTPHVMRSSLQSLAIIVSDGLSALAVHRQVPPLLACLLPQLRSDEFALAPVVIARFGRVAIQDPIGHLLGAQQALMLIGERPGLGSPDSLGAYLVFAPMPGNTDANRNCVSNIRPEGLPIDVAAGTIRHLLNESWRRQLSGISLKDERGLALSAAPREIAKDC